MQQLKPYENHAWIVFFGIAVLLTASGFYPLFFGLDPEVLERNTGITIEQLDAFDPDLAIFIAGLERLIGVAAVTGTALAAAVSWIARRGSSGRATWYALWLFPAMLLGSAGIFISGEGAGLGAFYGGAGLVAAAAHAFSYRRFA